MASAIENEIQINLVKAELAKKVKPSDLTTVQKRQLFDALFEEGAALHYRNAMVAVGDTVYGWGDANINGGGFFFGEVITAPPTQSNHISMKIAF